MIIVTGGAGFIGSNLIKGLNEQGFDEILLVDNLTNCVKFKNLVNIKFADYIDKIDFINEIKLGHFDHLNVEAIFHLGACSNTMETDGKYMMKNNYEYSKELMNFAIKKNIQFIYASSASVYGNGKNGFKEETECEGPINMYAFSKFNFDNYVRRRIENCNNQIVGLRFYNVFGPNECHKGKMASVMYHFYYQLKEKNEVRLFEGIDGIKDGEQKRDFVYVKDVVKVMLFFMNNKNKSGIFNCATGNAHTYNEVANNLIKLNGSGNIKYIKFPQELAGKYQTYTQADLSKLRNIGYKSDFTSLADAIKEYYEYIKNNEGYI